MAPVRIISGYYTQLTLKKKSYYPEKDLGHRKVIIILKYLRYI